jgi:hypothetical protein
MLHDPFPTPFTNEVLENVGGEEVYSFTDGFSGYHQIIISLEDRYKTTFATDLGVISIHSNSIWFKECTNNIF